MPVRATILALVDPKASELKPLYHPRLTAWGLVFWSVGALVAALVAWVIRLSELSHSWLDIAWSPPWAAWLVVLMTLVSGIGAASLIRPHPGLSGARVLRAAFGVALYLPLAWLIWYLYMRVDAGMALPVFGGDGPSERRVLVRLGIGVTMAMIILGLRPTARGLAMRSVVVRTGRVDRQSLLALLGAVGVAAVGDVLLLVTPEIHGPAAQALRSIEVVLVAVGSVLITIGLFGVAIDCVRLRPIIASRGIGITDILDDDRDGPGGER